MMKLILSESLGIFVVHGRLAWTPPSTVGKTTTQPDPCKEQGLVRLLKIVRLSLKALKRTHIAAHMVIILVVGFITTRTVVVQLMTNVKMADGASQTIPVGV